MKKYTKEEIIDLLNRNQKSGSIHINGTVDQIIGSLDFEDKELVLKEFIFDINHTSFKNLLIKGFDFKSLFNVSTISELSKKIIDESNNHIDYGYLDSKSTRGSDKLKGDLFEIFAEIFFKLTSSDNRVGITDYSVVKDTEDYGVDGVGTAINGLPATIQVKFRSNPTELLTIKDLNNLHGISYKKYNVPVGADNNIIIFTNCAGVHWNTSTNVLSSSTLTYGYYGQSANYNLKNLVDNNTSFWKNLQDMVDYNKEKFLG